ncbi:MAG: septal ring lytic transglycosylase RlpA family protein [Gammaproteobacteria bacterium]|nr:septal ring lytic transglycosylase RlpA family protein [Gammaproteobacteria bacterium]
MKSKNDSRQILNKVTTLLAVAVLLPALSACAGRKDSAPSTPVAPGQIREVVPKVEPRSASGNPAFYEVRGKRYHVLDDADGYRERGVASWYGKKFHGRPTATGERFDMYAASAAHKTLPLPAYARVTNLENGRSIIVRINDRGPFVANRLIDLSYGAAVELDMIGNGTSFVEVEVVTPKYGRRKHGGGGLPMVPGTLFVQVGAFSDRGNASRLRSMLLNAGLKDVVIRKDRVDGQRIYRVRVGPVANVDEFDATVERVGELGVSDAYLATE